ncbi:hypothetical protein D7U93_11195 [Stenotrophomonas maltophilia]|nr:hypothetical protein [Stenotrophomonas maltophilia]MBA0380019.1 hypothetical protein [Stenotrophomonas maltophilia]MBA0408622.1 hypothetical protein [Stenotrophomonas maltophilia]MBA0426313.1 hypothetical protein [Stenotrophomonas maltophilia]MBA0454499.1 hypothetical protein [Stenotrophomonas maltophilia]
MSWLHTFWNGVSPCLAPGVGGCVVWWDAWAAIGALMGVLATTVLGVFTYRLGRAANRASALAVEIAGNEAKRQADRDRKERILLLLQITGEVSTNIERILELHAHLSDPLSEGYFVVNADYRNDFMNSMKRVAFPLAERLADRYHYLDGLTGPTLVRAIGMFSTMADNYVALLAEQPEAELRKAYRLLFTMLPIVAQDLEVVRLACAEAVKESRIDDARVARLALSVADEAAN